MARSCCGCLPCLHGEFEAYLIQEKALSVETSETTCPTALFLRQVKPVTKKIGNRGHFPDLASGRRWQKNFVVSVKSLFMKLSMVLSPSILLGNNFLSSKAGQHFKGGLFLLVQVFSVSCSEIVRQKPQPGLMPLHPDGKAEFYWSGRQRAGRLFCPFRSTGKTRKSWHDVRGVLVVTC